MADYTPKPGSFSLFKNDRKERDSHPDYAGNGVNLDGTPCWINAWLKETRDGKKFFSISIKPKEARQDDGFRSGERAGGGGSGGFSGSDGFDPSDEIPFATPYSIR